MQSLEDLIGEHGALSVRDAIGWVVRVAKTLEPVHADLGAHGATSAAAVWVEGAACESEGALLEAPQAPRRVSYRGLARADGGEPSCGDDTWALAVLLYFLLTGTEPFADGVAAARGARGTITAPKPLGMHDHDIGVMQPLMDELIGAHRGWTPLPDAIIFAADLLAFSPAAADLPALPLLAADEIEAGPSAGPEDELATDESPADGAQPAEVDEPPPPRAHPAGSRPGPRVAATPRGAPTARAARRRRDAWGRLALLAAALIFVGGVVLVLTRPLARRDVHLPETASSAAHRGGPSTAAPSRGNRTDERPPIPATSRATAEAPGSGRPAGRLAPPAKGLASCALPLLAAELSSEPDLDFICEEPDVRRALRRMTATIARGRERQQRAAAHAWLSLGWYQMAAIALARHRCCASPRPLLAPRRLAGCRLGPALDALVRADGEAAFLTALRRYTRSVNCVASTWPQGFRYVTGPGLTQQSALLRKRSQALGR